MLSHHRLLVKCTINIWLQLLHVGFEIISYYYSQYTSYSRHLIIDFLVAKDKISSNVTMLLIFISLKQWFE